jgi:hypothetical protein
MRSDPLPATHVLRALELFGPQARPYNFDDMFDCWGLVRRVVDWLDGGAEANDELRDDGSTDALWRPIGDREGLLPGDLLVSHPRPHADFHTAFFCGRVGGRELVYDSSPRGQVPLFDAARSLVHERAVFTRFMRATETTDRLRHDGGAYLRLWDERQRFYHGPLHDRLAAGGDGARDLVELRRAAGLSDLPGYCTTRLGRDARGREVYDNLWSRDFDYYLPDGAAVLDDEYALWGGATGRDHRGADEAAVEPRPTRLLAPVIVGVPHRIVRDGGWTAEWRPGDGGDAAGRGEVAVESWRLEVWEETADLWRHRLLRADFEATRRRFEVPAELLRDDARFAVVLWARGRGGFSGDALATALWRPSPDNELLGYNANRPRGLWPDGLAAVAASGPGLALTWSIAEPDLTQTAARVRVLEDACLADDVAPVFETLLEGPAAAACRCALPAGFVRAGHTYAWYVDVRDAAGRWCYAPAEGVFRTEEDS